MFVGFIKCLNVILKDTVSVVAMAVNLRSLVDAGIAVCDEGNCQFKNPKVEKENQKKEVMSAWFDGLVDLVLDDNGKICFFGQGRWKPCLVKIAMNCLIAS